MNAVTDPLRVLHVFTDRKFLSDLRSFEGPGFDNRVILAGSGRGDGSGAESGVLHEFRTEVVGNDRTGVSRILAASREADLVVMHDLDALKSVTVSRMDPETAVGWRLYGVEIYSRRPAGLYTERTLQAVKGGAVGWLRPLRGLRAAGIQLYRWRTRGGTAFEAAVRRTDFLFGIVPDEHADLVARWGAMPEFVQLPVPPSFGETEPDMGAKKNTVLIGNSRSPYNNHLDVLDDIARFADGDTRFLLPFSYAGDGRYAAVVRSTARAIPGVELLESFQPKEEYARLFVEARAAVYNSFRQMALWNIFACMGHGVKLYLPDVNPVSQWLRRLGADISDVSRFGLDLESESLTLSPERARVNWSVIRDLSRDQSYAAFQRTLSRRLDATDGPTRQAR